MWYVRKQMHGYLGFVLLGYFFWVLLCAFVHLFSWCSQLEAIVVVPIISFVVFTH